MKDSRPWLFFCLFFLFVAQGVAQQKEGYRELVTQQVRSGKLGAPEHLRNYLVEGKLRLSLRDAVVLTLENNSFVRIQETQVESAKVSLLGAHQPFDPLLTGSYNANSVSFPPGSTFQITGVPTAPTTTLAAQFNYSETFWTGTNVQAGLSSTNVQTQVNPLNPSVTTALNFQLTQPLLKNGWRFPNEAPLVIARRNLEQSQANFAAQVSNSILQAVAQYWAVVEARGNLDVAKRSLEAAEASYKRDKRALELGALPPLDIYRSESQVASRRVQVIQGEYSLKEAEDALRMTIGADQDAYFEALDLELTEAAEPEGELRTSDAATALQQALVKRPEVEVARQALAIDDTRIRLAHNHLLPELDLTGIYAGNGVGGAQFNAMGNKITSSSLNQLFGFGYPTYGGQLSLTLPLKNRGAKAELGNALVSRRSDLYGERQVREQVMLDVNNAVHQLEQAKLSIAAGKEALDLAKKNTAAEQRKYELGQGTIFLVLEAQTEEATAEQTLLQAQVGYQLAVAGLDHATGELLEPYHVQIAELAH
ncbi:putative Outer membrane efflux protein [Candidatus Sulfotelmatobacter kueseliae]|uniref:Putative Outer membrane efflux protein n=1 Tax=Candidatus Sulfotelmatobacter kueseliae TaxID=2042962 RepID=A0A2U3KGT8_9BACT|nr:putative Outer membrane efflux protein [Candidatus Sulfotelmatobacter kueseliae]